jgi:hypothetical protein
MRSQFPGPAMAPSPTCKLAGPRREATPADFRVLRENLIKLDKTRRWGSLSYHITSEGVYLYVCADQLAANQRLPSAPPG